MSTNRMVFRRSHSSLLTETIVLKLPDGWYVSRMVEDEYGRAICSCYCPDQNHETDPKEFAHEREVEQA